MPFLALTQAVTLRYAPAKDSRAEYSVRLTGRTSDGGEPTEAAESYVFSERVVAVRPDGTRDVNRYVAALLRSSSTGSTFSDRGELSGFTVRYRVTPTNVWTAVSERARSILVFDLALPDEPVNLGESWVDPRLAPYRLSVERTAAFAGRRGAVVRFAVAPGERDPGTVEPGSYAVYDLADGRPLFARIVLGIPLGDRPGTGTVLVRRTDLPGLIPKLDAGTD